MTQHHLHLSYTRKGLWRLFLTAAFPIHVWTLIRIFEDVAWVADRTNPGDAIGLGAYGLMYALVESAFVFLTLALLGLLLPRAWQEDKRLAFLSTLYLSVVLWALVSQIDFENRVALPPALRHLLYISGHPLWILYGTLGALIALTTVLPAFCVYKSERATPVIMNVIERLSLLTSLYLFIDLIGIFIVIGRNL